MQLRCSVLVDSRISITSKLRQRYNKGILILRHGKISEIDEYELVLFTPQARKGRLFTITRDNIKRIHSTKIQWGSAVIEMNYPSIMICIKEASIPCLRNFISKLQQILAGEEVILDKDKEVTSSDFASLRKKLVISSRKQYKEHKLGFPSYLRELTLSNIGLASVDSRWFGATSLHRLDLSGNKLGKSDAFEIKFLNIVRLRHLKELILADNEIRCISDDLWQALPKNLLSLDLSNNQISYLSPYCTQFPQMTHLSLSHNKIEKLPRTISSLTNLQCLDISWNRIKFLPSEIKNLSLDRIDVTAYNGEENSQMQDILDRLLQTANPLVKIGSLFEYAAAAVMNYRISLTSLSGLLRLMVQDAVENCKRKSEGSYRFYPASIVTARYRIDDARSLAFTAISRNHYSIILQDMEAI
ncbi:Leucine-rich repeat protein [Dirofilaria immitis]